MDYTSNNNWYEFTLYDIKNITLDKSNKWSGVMDCANINNLS